MATMCPDFKAAVHKVLEKHTATTHAFSGGVGISCFVWVSGPAVTPKGNPSAYKVRNCFGSNGLDLTGAINEDLKALPGYVGHQINID